MENGSAEIPLLISCPRCPSNVSFARRIDPLHQLSSQLKQRNSLRREVLQSRIERYKKSSPRPDDALTVFTDDLVLAVITKEVGTLSQSGSPTTETPTDVVANPASYVLPRSPSRISQPDQRSPSLTSHSSDGSSGKQGFFNSFMRKKPILKKTKTDERVASPLSLSARDIPIGLPNAASGITPPYAFSAVGTQLMIWTDDTLLWYNIESGIAQTETIPGIQLAAAGNDVYALILRKESVNISCAHTGEQELTKPAAHISTDPHPPEP